MTRKAVLIVMTVLLAALALAVPASAVSGLTVTESAVTVNFPASITFSVAAGSDADITDIRLHYRIERLQYAEVTSEVYIEFNPAPSVSEQYVLDMRKTGSLPPGSGMVYWWTVTDADGDRVVTVPELVAIDDERYDWNSITEGPVTLYWYNGDENFARGLMDAVGQALVSLAGDTGAVPEGPVRIYIYASASDLRGSLIFPQEWTGGVAFTQYGAIAIGIDPGNADWGKRTIAHELTHLVVNRLTFGPYSSVPTWLDEGLAQITEGEMEPYFTLVLDGAISNDELISVRSLASPFSAIAEISYLSYAQSYSITEYLLDAYGRESMSELLEVLGEGSGYDAALQTVYGFDMDGLDARWREHVGAAPRPAAAPVS